MPAAVVDPGHIYTSTDSGSNWTEQTSAGSRSWTGIASSSDGTKLAAIVNGGSIWTGCLEPSGALQVSLIPQEAITAGAKWRVDGGQWQNSGSVVTGLSIGEHSVSFNSLANWASPTSQDVMIVNDHTETVLGTYVQKVKGDVNGDEEVNLVDAILCLQVLSGLAPNVINSALLVDDDGRIGLAETIYAVQKAAGL